MSFTDLGAPDEVCQALERPDLAHSASLTASNAWMAAWRSGKASGLSRAQAAAAANADPTVVDLLARARTRRPTRPD